MDCDEARSILGTIFVDISPTDWTAIEDTFSGLGDDERHRAAEALATVWRHDSSEPGFMRPAGSLIRLVEAELGGERILEPSTAGRSD